jgi:hypothetical protein
MFMWTLGACLLALCVPQHPVTAQFAPTVAAERNKDIQKELKKLQASCKKGDGQACYEIARMIWGGETEGSNPNAAWELASKACGYGYGAACREVNRHNEAIAEARRQQAEMVAEKERQDSIKAAEKQAERARREAAQREYALQQARERAAKDSADKANGKTGGSLFGSILKTAAIVGSGTAAAIAAGDDATEEQREAIGAQAMSIAAAAVGENEAAEAFAGMANGTGSALSGSISGAAAATASGGGGEGLTGSWSYNGALSAQVRHLLTAVPNWSCPAHVNERGVPPRLGVRTSSQRDEYVASAVMVAWGIECYARQGKPDMVAKYEPVLRQSLQQANALCSNSLGSPGRGSPATLAIWGCPPPIR